LHGDLCGLAVANFADHYFVGIMAQDRAQSTRETSALLLIDGICSTRGNWYSTGSSIVMILSWP
jgi:hypothetical protein